MTTYFLRTVVGQGGADAPDRERLANLVHNTGNLFFEEAVSRQLYGCRTVGDLELLPYDAQTLVLSMSNFISPATDLGWLADFIEARRVAQVVMIGAGAQAESFSHPLELSEGTRRFVALLSHRSESIGVRGYFTAEVLNRLGIRNVDVIGCPSLFFGNDRGFRVDKPDLGGRRPRTVAHCTPYGNYRDAVGHLLSFAVRECEAYVAQSEPALLFDAENEERRRFFFHYYNDGDFADAELEAWMHERVRWFFDLESWLGYMSRMEFSVGARFHGNMAALQVGVPALNLVCDSRTRELCEYLNLPFAFFDDFDGRSSAAELYERTDFSAFNAGFAEKYDRYRAFLARNGLRHRMGGGAGATDPIADRVAAIRAESVAAFVRSLGAAELAPEALIRELSLRLRPDRSEATMKLADCGAFDLRAPRAAAVDAGDA